MARLAFTLCLLLLVAPALAQEAAITGVHVVDVRTGEILLDRLVLIADGRIQSVEEDDAVPEGVEVLDGAGHYLIPGLWDMHAHLRHPVAPTVIMPQLVAHGVTGVREMGSGCQREGVICLPQLKAWQAEIEAGERLGPRILQLSSFALNPPWDYEVTEEQARGLVRELHGRGADFMKTYYRLSPEAFGWFVDEARVLGIGAAGHLPLRMTAAEASDAGIRSIEHVRDLLFDCFPGSAEFRASARSQTPPTATARAMVDTHDEEVCAATFETLVRNGTAYVPTHVTRRMDAFADDPDFRDDPRARYVPPFLWADWQEDADGMVAHDPSPEGRQAMRDFHELGLAITGRAHGAGVTVLLGTDGGDTYSFFGSSVHDELAEFVAAGLTPAEALAAATLRPAEFLGLEADHGTVETGRHADLVLLRANPLDAIENVREIETVILGGRVHDRASLDAMLKGAAEAAAATGE